MFLRAKGYEPGMVCSLPGSKFQSLKDSDLKGCAVLVKQRRKEDHIIGGSGGECHLMLPSFLCWSFLGPGDLGGDFFLSPKHYLGLM